MFQKIEKLANDWTNVVMFLLAMIIVPSLFSAMVVPSLIHHPFLGLFTAIIYILVVLSFVLYFAVMTNVGNQSIDVLTIPKINKKNVTVVLIGIVSVWLITNVLPQVLPISTPDNQNVLNHMLSQLSGTSILVYALNVGFIAPVMEEFIFRAWWTSQAKNKFIAGILSSVIFGVCHVVPTDVNTTLQWVVYASAGLCLWCVYKKTNNVWCSAIVHIASNTSVLVAYLHFF